MTHDTFSCTCVSAHVTSSLLQADALVKLLIPSSPVSSLSRRSRGFRVTSRLPTLSVLGITRRFYRSPEWSSLSTRGLSVEISNRVIGSRILFLFFPASSCRFWRRCSGIRRVGSFPSFPVSSWRFFFLVRPIRRFPSHPLFFKIGASS